MERNFVLMDGRINIFKTSLLLQTIYRVNTVPTKIPESFSQKLK